MPSPPTSPLTERNLAKHNKAVSKGTEPLLELTAKTLTAHDKNIADGKEAFITGEFCFEKWREDVFLDSADSRARQTQGEPFAQSLDPRKRRESDWEKRKSTSETATVGGREKDETRRRQTLQ